MKRKIIWKLKLNNDNKNNLEMKNKVLKIKIIKK